MTTETLIAGSDNTQAGEQTEATTKVEGEGAVVPEVKVDDATKTPETKNEEANPAEADKPYEFKLPEGIEVDSAEAESFSAIAKELKLPQEAAQKIVDFAVAREAKMIETRNAAVAAWAESVKTDKDIGGDKLAENLATARKAIDLGPPELKELLNASGFGNHPAIVKWAVAVGKALSEDRFVSGTKAPAGAEKSAAERLYGAT